MMPSHIAGLNYLNPRRRSASELVDAKEVPYIDHGVIRDYE